MALWKGITVDLTVAACRAVVALLGRRCGCELLILRGGFV